MHYFRSHYYGARVLTPSYFLSPDSVTMDLARVGSVRKFSSGVAVDFTIASNVKEIGGSVRRRPGLQQQPGDLTWSRQYDFWFDGLSQYSRKPTYLES